MSNTLTDRINRKHAEINSDGHMMPIAVECGKLLHRVKAKSERGEWLPWIENDFEGSQRTASNYMRLATAADEGKLPKGWEEMPINHCLKTLKPTRKRSAAKQSESTESSQTESTEQENWQLVANAVASIMESARKLTAEPIPFKTSDDGMARLMTWKETRDAIIEGLHVGKEETSTIGTASGEWDEQTGEMHASKSTRTTKHIRKGVVHTIEGTSAPRSGYGEHPDCEGHGIRVTVKVEVI